MTFQKQKLGKSRGVFSSIIDVWLCLKYVFEKSCWTLKSLKSVTEVLKNKRKNKGNFLLHYLQAIQILSTFKTPLSKTEGETYSVSSFFIESSHKLLLSKSLFLAISLFFKIVNHEGCDDILMKMKMQTPRKNFWKFYVEKFILTIHTAQKMKFSIMDFFSKCDQVCSFLQIWSHLLKKSLMENFFV